MTRLIGILVVTAALAQTPPPPSRGAGSGPEKATLPLRIEDEAKLSRLQYRIAIERAIRADSVERQRKLETELQQTLQEIYKRTGCQVQETSDEHRRLYCAESPNLQ